MRETKPEAVCYRCGARFRHSEAQAAVEWLNEHQLNCPPRKREHSYNVGWACPLCDRIWSPDIEYCKNHPPTKEPTDAENPEYVAGSWCGNCKSHWVAPDNGASLHFAYCSLGRTP